MAPQVPGGVSDGRWHAVQVQYYNKVGIPPPPPAAPGLYTEMQIACRVAELRRKRASVEGLCEDTQAPRCGRYSLGERWDPRDHPTPGAGRRKSLFIAAASAGPLLGAEIPGHSNTVPRPKPSLPPWMKPERQKALPGNL